MGHVEVQNSCKHIFFVPDGNGRFAEEWAKKGTYMPTEATYSLGAKKGIDLALAIFQARLSSVVTVLVSTSANVQFRKSDEMDGIHGSLSTLTENRARFLSDGVRVNVIGDIDLLDGIGDLREQINELLIDTVDGSRVFNLVLGFNPNLHIGDERTIRDIPDIDIFYRTGARKASVGLSGVPAENAELVFDRVLWPQIDVSRALMKIRSALKRLDRNPGGRTEAQNIMGETVQEMAIRVNPDLLQLGIRIGTEDSYRTDHFALENEVSHKLIAGYILSGMFMCRAFPEMKPEKRHMVSLYLVTILLADLLFDDRTVSSTEIESALRSGAPTEIRALASVQGLLQLLKNSAEDAFGDAFQPILNEITDENGIFANMARERTAEPESVEAMLDISKKTIGSGPLLKTILLAGEVDEQEIAALEPLLDAMAEVIRMENDYATLEKERDEGTSGKNTVELLIRSKSNQDRAGKRIARKRIQERSAYIEQAIAGIQNSSIRDLLRRAQYIAKNIYGRKGGYDTISSDSLKRIIDRYPIHAD